MRMDGGGPRGRPIDLLALTKENDVNALTLKLLHALLPRLDVPVVRIVDDDLPSLDCEEVPDLVLYLGLDAPPEGVGCFGSGCWGYQRREEKRSRTMSWPVLQSRRTHISSGSNPMERS